MSAITAGDLVIAARGHRCVLERVGGIPFRVAAVLSWHNPLAHCPKCGEKNIYYGGSYVDFMGANVPTAWLIKIDPPAQPEGVERKQEVTA